MDWNDPSSQRNYKTYFNVIGSTFVLICFTLCVAADVLWGRGMQIYIGPFLLLATFFATSSLVHGLKLDLAAIMQVAAFIGGVIIFIGVAYNFDLLQGDARATLLNIASVMLGIGFGSVVVRSTKENQKEEISNERE